MFNQAHTSKTTVVRPPHGEDAAAALGTWVCGDILHVLLLFHKTCCLSFEDRGGHGNVASRVADWEYAGFFFFFTVGSLGKKNVLLCSFAKFYDVNIFTVANLIY